MLPMTEKKPKRTAAEPYGYDEPGYPPGQRKRRPDGYEPYRDRRSPPDLDKADFRDGREHPETDAQHYGESPKDGGSQKPAMPGVKTQR
jgi:hypothetical protein